MSDDVKWAAVACRLAISTVCHPIEYGKTLIQLGHEPIRPYLTKTLFGRTTYALPGIFQYVGHIRKVDGLSGCYNGVGLRLCSLTVQSVAHAKTFEALDEESERNNSEEGTFEEKWKRFRKSTGNELAAKVVATIASQPLHVCVVRCMAQFVGKETRYCGIISCVRETYNQGGILGFFSGLIPRILAEVFQLLIASTLTYYVNNYLLKDEDQQHYAVVGMNFIASTITYPLLVVSNCMIVSGSGLLAGSPPCMPIYGSWWECFGDLYSKGQHKRGSSLLWRYIS